MSLLRWELDLPHDYFDKYRGHENRPDTGPVAKKTHKHVRAGAGQAGDAQFDPYGEFQQHPTSVDYYTGNPDHDPLDNILIGDCVCADIGHCVNQLEWQAALPQTANDRNCLLFYQEISGYVPGDPSTDIGSQLTDALTAMCAGGLGGQKFIDHFPISPLSGDGQIQWGIYNLLGTHGGLQLPVSAMDQLNAGEPWTVVGGPIDVGHATYFVGYDPDWFYCNTYGIIQRMSYEFLDYYYEEMHVSISFTMMDSVGLGAPNIDPGVMDNNWQYTTGSTAQPIQRGPFEMIL